MRRWWLIPLCLGVFALLAWMGYRYYETHIKVEPEKLLLQALDQTLAAPSYRYEVDAELVTGDRRKVLSRVAGERDHQGNLRFAGELAGEKVEACQVGDTTYLLDSKSGKWLVIPGNELGKQKMLMAEIAPLSNLEFHGIGPVLYRGRQKDELGNNHILEFRPQVANEFMNTWFTGFAYQVLVERHSHRLRQVVIRAQSKTSPQTQVKFTIRLHDYGAKFEVKAPV